MIARAIVGVREIDLITVELAALDALGDLDLALAREQRHRAHLAQVHADGIVGLVERAGRQIELDVFAAVGPVEQLVLAVLLLRIDDLDAGVAKRAEQVVQLLGRSDVRRAAAR